MTINHLSPGASTQESLFFQPQSNQTQEKTEEVFQTFSPADRLAPPFSTLGGSPDFYLQDREEWLDAFQGFDKEVSFVQQIKSLLEEKGDIEGAIQALLNFPDKQNSEIFHCIGIICHWLEVTLCDHGLVYAAKHYCSRLSELYKGHPNRTAVETKADWVILTHITGHDEALSAVRDLKEEILEFIEDKDGPFVETAIEHFKKSKVPGTRTQQMQLLFMEMLKILCQGLENYIYRKEYWRAVRNCKDLYLIFGDHSVIGLVEKRALVFQKTDHEFNGTFGIQLQQLQKKVQNLLKNFRFENAVRYIERFLSPPSLVKKMTADEQDYLLEICHWICEKCWEEITQHQSHITPIQVINWCNQISRLLPFDSSRIYLTKALALTVMGNYREALEWISHILQRDDTVKQDTRLLHLQACCLYKLGYYEESKNICDFLLKANPCSLSGRTLIKILVQVGQYEVALQHIMSQLFYYPQDPILSEQEYRIVAAMYKQGEGRKIGEDSQIIFQDQVPLL
jgi:tetratricopeptide (TPR) repeat protein